MHVNVDTRLSPETRAGIFYATFFMSGGAVGAYFAIWLSGKGISSGDIGIISSLPVFLMLAINLVVGRLADRADDWRTVIIVGALLAGLMPVGLFFVDDFWGILLVWTLAVVPMAAIAPVIDAATVRMTRRNGSDFARIRAWGTLGFMVALGATGYVVAFWGPGAYVPFLVFVCVLRAAASLLLPRFRAPEHLTPQPVVAVAKKVSQVFTLWFTLPVFAFAMVMGTLLLFNTFAALVWKNAGHSEAIIGPLLALGALAEAVMMFAFVKLGKRFSARHLILISAVVSAARWAIMAFNPPLWILALLQLTHGVSFGFGYLGMVNFIANWTSEDMAAEVQSMAVVVQQAMSVIAVIGFGYLLQIMGAQAFLVAAAVCVLAAICVWQSLRIRAISAETESGPAD